MNIEYLNIYLAAYALHNRVELGSLDIELFSNPNVKEIIKQARTLNIKSEIITRGLLISCVSPTLYAIMDKIYQLWNRDLSLRNLEDIKKELFEIKNQLKEYHKRTWFANQLKELAELAEKGEIDYVNKKIWSLHLNSEKEVDTTLMYMLDSINDTNGFKTGIGDIDERMGGLHRGNLMGIFGDTGSMKTMVSLWMMMRILEQNPKMIGVYFEKEMPIKDLARRIISYCMGVTIQDVMAKDSEEDKSKFGNDVLDYFKANPKQHDIIRRLHLIPRNMIKSTSDIVEFVRYYKADIWCLDYMTMLFEHASESKDSNSIIMKEMLVLKDLVDRTDSLGIILGQLKQSTVELRNNKIPTMSDIEWGKQLKQFAAYMFATFYPYSYYENIVPKDYFYLLGLKGRHSGKETIPLTADPRFARFCEVDPFDPPGYRSNQNEWLKQYISNKGLA